MARPGGNAADHLDPDVTRGRPAGPRHLLFACPPAHGHVEPTLPVASELVRRGWRITYATHERFAPAAKRVGATHIRTTSVLPELAGVVPGRIGGMVEDLVACARADVPLIAAYLEDNPVSAVCFDRMVPLSIGPILAEQAGVPGIATWPSLATCARTNPLGNAGPVVSGQFDDPAMHRVGRAITDLAAEYGLAGREETLIGPVGATTSELNIVFVAPAFQPDIDSFDGSFRFVGPALGEQGDDESWVAPDGEPLIYVSLDIGFDNRPDIFRTCVQAFGDIGRPVAIAIGNNVTRGELGPIPANIDIRPRFPQRAVLRHAGVFVSNAGMNSVMESLYHGVPLLALPQVIEQQVNARRVEQLGLGVRLDPAAVTPTQLRTVVTNLLHDDPTHARITYQRASARAAGGAVAAADAIEEHLG